MLIKRKFVDSVHAATSGVDLHTAVQQAIVLEHSTIPPYLAAAYSLKQPGINAEIQGILVDIAREEMLHMAIAANLLLAIGGKPDLTPEHVLPAYPGPLPMGVAGGITVGIQPFSMQLVEDIFMRIEQPNEPLKFPIVAPLDAAAEGFATIGDFYGAIGAKLTTLGDAAFIGDPARQVVVDAGFPSEQLYPITNLESALRAIEWLVSEGEGTKKSPLDGESEPAHYYRFEEIVNGRRLVADASSQLGYVYGGHEIHFDATQVFDIPANAKAADHAPGSAARRAVDAFNKGYCDMLRILHRAFSEDPKAIADAVSAMALLRRTASNVVRRTGDNGRNLPLTFEYMPAA